MPDSVPLVTCTELWVNVKTQQSWILIGIIFNCNICVKFPLSDILFKCPTGYNCLEMKESDLRGSPWTFTMPMIQYYYSFQGVLLGFKIF
jgi:hypothetical protein